MRRKKKMLSIKGGNANDKSKFFVLISTICHFIVGPELRGEFQKPKSLLRHWHTFCWKISASIIYLMTALMDGNSSSRFPTVFSGPIWRSLFVPFLLAAKRGKLCSAAASFFLCVPRPKLNILFIRYYHENIISAVTEEKFPFYLNRLSCWKWTWK